MLIRPALPTELTAVGDLTVAAYTADGHLGLDSPYVHELRDAASRAAGATLLVAVDDDPDGVGAPPLGTVTFCLAGTPYAEVSRDGEAEFRMLAVSPQARNRGIGRDLTRRCIEMARQAGATGLALCSMESMTRAQDIYRRFGFERLPERDWEPTPGLTLLAFRVTL